MNQFAAIKAVLHQMLGPDIGIGVVNPKTPDATLLPEEEPAMTRAVAKRQLEFTAGRAATRQAMKGLGYPPVAVPMAVDRSPVWPDGLVGSITHSDDICITVLAYESSRHSIGIDIEAKTPLDPELEQIICVASEGSWLDAQPVERRAYLAKEVFCAKESIYKALYPLARQVIGFDALEVELPLRRDSRVILNTDNRSQRLAIELQPFTIANRFFVYAHLTAAPSHAKHASRLTP